MARLKQRNRKAWQRAESTIDYVAQNPHAGTALRGEWEGARRLHFWRDKYRLIWEPDDEAKTVTVLVAGPKYGVGGKSIYDQPPPME